MMSWCSRFPAWQSETYAKKANQNINNFVKSIPGISGDLQKSFDQQTRYHGDFQLILKSTTKVHKKLFGLD